MPKVRMPLRIASIVASAVVGTLLALLSAPYFGIDFSVYRAGGEVLLHGASELGKLYTHPLFYLDHHNGLLFTYPSFAAIIFIPMALMPPLVGLWLMTGWGIAAAAGMAYLIWRLLTGSSQKLRQMTRAQVMQVCALAVAVPLLGPWRDTFTFGQINIVLMSLVMIDLLLPRSRWPLAGVLTGIAAGIKLTPLAFMLYFLVRKDWRGLLNLVLGFAGTIVVSLILRPVETLQYWTHIVFATGRVGGVGYIDNISLKGTLSHIFGPHAHVNSLWFFSVAIVALLGGAVIFWATKLSDTFGAISAAALVMLLVSPVSWSHHFVWIALVIPALFAATFRSRAVIAEPQPRYVRVFTAAVLVFALLSFYLSPKVIGFVLGMANLGDQRPGAPIMVASIGTLAAVALLLSFALTYHARLYKSAHLTLRTCTDHNLASQ